MSKTIKVCVDARLRSSYYGGVEQFIIGLAHGLTQLNPPGIDIKYLVEEGEEAWLTPYINAPVQFIYPSRSMLGSTTGWRAWAKRKLPMVKRLWHESSLLPVSIPRSDGTIERHEVDVLHFAKQDGFLTDLPTIYQPHDLQHLHLPEFFTPREQRVREKQYRTFCHRARKIVVVSQWIKEDLIQQYELPQEKIEIIRYAPPLSTYRDVTTSDLASVTQTYDLPVAFVFYPAQTWEHKNHIRLLEAIHKLRIDHGVRVSFVSTGSKNEHFANVWKKVEALQLEDQVHFLGFVSPTTIYALYKLATMVVIPTLFEAASFPMWEAFLAGTPVACSNVTSLPDQAGDAAVIFDPYDVASIAEAIHRLWSSNDARAQLVEAGTKRVAALSWVKTAEEFCVLYEQISNNCKFR